MRLLLAALFVVIGSVAAWAFADDRAESPERRTPERFLDLLAPGDSVLVLPQGDGYSVTVLTADELRQLQPTTDELKEFRELQAEYNRSRKAADRGTQWENQHRARFAELSEKVHRPLPKIVAVGENYVGWQQRNGRIEYWPERQITLIIRGLPRPFTDVE